MKFLVLTSLSLILANTAIAATAVCKKAASERANSAVEKRTSDDCFQKYVQEAKNDPNTIYVGISCDHSGSYQYKIVTAPAGSKCNILKVTSKWSD